MEGAQVLRPYRNVFSAMISDYAEARTEQFRRRVFANTVKELERLSDRQLNDIGVPREQIKQRAYQSVYFGIPYRQS